MSNFASGILFVIIGVTCLLIIGRRRFYRRNESGLEEFDNYTKAVATSFIEGIIQIIATIMIFLGGLFAVVFYFVG
ncbi:hypothetical protein [Cardiobacterium sp. Marseille-Q4385]|uniref:hypothetical protein n=1 Tax=Cardiobacterium sp. Marseille-Q4385 TaxID=2866573 RepID=UPI001CE3C6D6|nr:hypothetical protein [Cardiobacterium sp. Marseille-Q4385]